MVKREHIKQAIDAITLRSPEVGYSLEELLGVGRINALPPDQAVAENGDFRFLFRDEILTVRRFLFINYGHLPIEQQMLIKFGEMRESREVLDSGAGLSYRTAAEEVRAAGLRFLVDYEIDLALDQLSRPHSSPSTAAGADAQRADTAARTDSLLERLVRLKAERSNEADLRHRFSSEASERPLFSGFIGTDTPALFVTFPYCRKALEQAAELNLEFFPVRFLLNTLIRGNANRLFACIVHGRIAGLIYLNMKVRLFYRALEIGYLAAVQGRIPALPGRRLRGVGSFLVAGTWMLWKTCFPRAREVVLDSEVGATRFYQAIGFQARRAFSYALEAPKGYLLDSIIGLAEGNPDLPSKVLQEIAAHLRKQIKALAKVSSGNETAPIRRPTLRAARRSMLSRHHALLAKSTAETLLKYRNRIPEANELLRIAAEYSNLRFPKEESGSERLVAVVHDLLFTEHLKGIFHMESAQRIRAVDAALRNNSVAHKCKAVAPRAATDEELAWVHTRSHIEKIARTAGKEIVSLDLDTQTTPRSCEIARLAVGGVFNLLDEIWNGDSRRGFAFVRPPGHHAEPDKAMGFCLFNNTALGARYLELVYGLEKIMIVDIDAHHGNGTQKVFYSTNNVLYTSFHQFPSFPGTGNLGEIGTGRGEGFTINIPLAKGSVDRDFAQAIHGVIRPVAEEYEPDALLVSCGFDLCQADRLTGMNGTAEGYALMAFFLKEIADQVCDGKLVYILEGGYNVRCIEECTLRTLQELSDISTLDPERIERIRTTGPHRIPALQRVIEAQKKHWKSLG